MDKGLNIQPIDHIFPKFSDADIREAFDCFDISSNGYISVEELKFIFETLQEEVQEEEIDEMIKLADKEGDGQEFIKGVVKNF
jgi:calmodulin